MPQKGLTGGDFINLTTTTTAAASAMESKDDFQLDHHPLRYSCFFLVLGVQSYYRHYERRLRPLLRQF